MHYQISSLRIPARKTMCKIFWRRLELCLLFLKLPHMLCLPTTSSVTIFFKLYQFSEQWSKILLLHYFLSCTPFYFTLQFVLMKGFKTNPNTNNLCILYRGSDIEFIFDGLFRIPKVLSFRIFGSSCCLDHPISSTAFFISFTCSRFRRRGLSNNDSTRMNF